MEWILSLGQSDIEFMVADGSVYDAECVTPTPIYHSQMTHLTDKYPIATESNMFVIFVLFVCFFFVCWCVPFSQICQINSAVIGSHHRSNLSLALAYGLI